MNKVLRILVAGCCLFGLIYIRFRESELFYDPLINYFHGEYQNNPLPEISQWKLFVHLLLRYILNTLLSMGILWAIFLETQILKFSSLIYTIVGLLLMLMLYFLVQIFDPKSYLSLFYVRRFLIQPLILFLLIPAFFYARKVNR